MSSSASNSSLSTLAVVLREPEQLELRRVDLSIPGEADVVVDIEWTGISTGTERLVVVRPHAAVSRAGLSAGPRLRVGRPHRRRRRAQRHRRRRTRLRSGRALLRRCSRLVRRRGFAGRRAGARVTPIGERLGEQGSCWRSRHRLSRARGAGAALAGPDRRSWRARPAARAARASLRVAPPVVWERNPQSGGGRHRLHA